MKRVIRVGERRVEYTFISSRGRDNVLLQALPERKIRVYAPKGAHLRALDALVRDRMDWIDRMHRQLDEETKTAPLSEFQTVLLEGKRVKLNVNAGAHNQIAFIDGEIVMTTRLESDEDRLMQLKRWLYRLALERVRASLNRWSPTVGIPYGRVAIREQRTRWGSCSSKRNLNFNWKLVLAPPEALEYVVIHELCHLKDFNHSERFWSEVRLRMPEYEIWKKWLHAHGKELCFP